MLDTLVFLYSLGIFAGGFCLRKRGRDEEERGIFAFVWIYTGLFGTFAVFSFWFGVL